MTKETPLSYFLVTQKKKPSKERVKMALDYIKHLITQEPDETNRKHLASAGIELNSILLRL
jgi:hypothetical protein